MSAKKYTHQERMKWFHEARFGMMIHWGLYSLLGQGTWAMHHGRIPHHEYAKLADEFKPRKFDPNKWAELAAECGMRYMVLTTRHHDGYCLWDSKVSDFTSEKCAAKRDFVAEYVEACRKAGLKVGIYYSLLDWRFPGFFERTKYRKSAQAMVQQAHDQLRELLTDYGRIDMIWFDGHWFAEKPGAWRWESHKPIIDFWRTNELVRMMRRLQPHIIFNDRTGVDGDYLTAEQEVSAISRPHREWEAAQTIGDYWESWCYQRFMPNPSRKTVFQLIIQLMLAASGGGNFMLNVGPTPDGEFPKEDIKRYKAIGEWLRVNGDAIYDSKTVPWPTMCALAQMTTNGNNAYVMMPNWPKDEFVISGVGTKPTSATFLRNGDALIIDYRKDGRLFLKGLPKTPPDPYVTVVKLTFDSPLKQKHPKNRAQWIYGPDRKISGLFAARD